MFKSASKSTAVVAVFVSAWGIAACGESASEKATKQVCSATSDITTQIKKLETLPITSSFPTEAKESVEAIGKDITKIKDAQPNLPSAQQEELNAAARAFQVEIATITANVVSASKSSNVETALKTAEPQIRASVAKIGNDYKKAFKALKCS